MDMPVPSSPRHRSRSHPATPPAARRSKKRRAGREGQEAGRDFMRLEALEDRRLLSAGHAAASAKPAVTPNPVSVSNGVLTVNAPDTDDTIVLSTDGTTTTVSVDGSSQDVPNASYTALQIYGNGGNDSITVGNGIIGAQIFGNAGNDTIQGGQGADTINGGPGIDTVDYSNRTTDLEILLDGATGASGLQTSGANGGQEGDIITGCEIALGGSGNDEIKGNLNVSYQLFGNGGNDTLIGGPGTDTLNGGPGDDTLSSAAPAAGAGADVYIGGPGFDSADFRFRTDNLTLQIDGQPDSGANGGAEGITINHDVERIVGGSGNDLIVGDDNANSLDGRDGNDTILGNGGNDSIDGGNGNDSLDGGTGDDVLTGQAGNDTMLGEAGNDTFIADDGQADTLDGGPGTDTVLSADPALDTFISIENGAGLPQPTITVTDNGQTETNNFATVDFGTVAPGATPPTQTFTVTDAGNAPLTLGQVTLPAGFSLVVAPSSTVAVGASTTFTVRLDTTTAGSDSGVMSFSTNVANENPFNINLTGAVVAPAVPVVSVTVNKSTLTNGSTTPINFGSALLGGTAPSLTFTVANGGTGLLTPGAVQVPAGFLVTQQLPASIAPGSSATFTVAVDTSAAGAHSGVVSFTTNDGVTNLFSFVVQASVLAPAVSVAVGTTAVPNNSASPIDFGNVVQGSAGPTRAFTVSNGGGAPLTLSNLTLPAGYVITKSPASVIAAGGSTTFTVQLVSSALGTFDGNLTFNTTDPLNSTFTIPLTGDVVAAALPAMVVSVTQGKSTVAVGNNAPPLSFGSALLGAAAPSLLFTVANAGTGSLTLGKFTLPAGFTVTNGPALTTLAKGQSTTFTVQLSTAAAGSFTGAITIPNNDPTNNPFVLNVAGTIALPAPVISVVRPMSKHHVGAVPNGSTQAVSFGSVPQGAFGPYLTFTVLNGGTSTLKIHGVYPPAGFRLLGHGPRVVGIGQSAVFSIQMTTASAGSFSGQVGISNTDPTQRYYTFNVAGTVTAVQGVQASVSGDTLTVTGTDGNDTIIIGQKKGGIINVFGNGVLVGGAGFSGISKIVVNAGAGNDSVTMAGVSLNGTLNGEDGNDTLVGGNGNDVLNGGNGDDSLDGGPGDDELLGGEGNDYLVGNTGVDVMKGEDGNDTIIATDGIADSLVDGGPGNDVIRKDRVDPWTGT